MFHSAVKPSGLTSRESGRNFPEKLGLGQVEESETRVSFPERGEQELSASVEIELEGERNPGACGAFTESRDPCVDSTRAEPDRSRTGLERQGLVAPAGDHGPLDTPEIRNADDEHRLVPQNVRGRDVPTLRLRPFELSPPPQGDFIERDLVDAPVANLRGDDALDFENRGKKPGVTDVGKNFAVRSHAPVAVRDRQDRSHQRLLPSPLFGDLALHVESSRFPLPHQHAHGGEGNQENQDENADDHGPRDGRVNPRIDFFQHANLLRVNRTEKRRFFDGGSEATPRRNEAGLWRAFFYVILGRKRWPMRVLWSFLLLFPFASFASGQEVYDVLIRGGRVLDGSGNPFIRADVGLRGDTVAAIGDLSDASAARTVDASGKYVVPGFIALHEHIDHDILEGNGGLPNFTTQGFTTAVLNADGRTALWPVSQQRAAMEKAGSALNVVMMVGHGTVRSRVMGDDFRRPATAAEIAEMKALVRQGMEEGAFGLSTGLEYVPMRYSTEEEVMELAKEVAPFGGHYQAHLRSQGQYAKWQLPSYEEKPVTQIDAVMETLQIAKLAGIPVMLDHLHPKGPREWGSGKIITQLVDRAWQEGHQVYINMHSYEAYDENIILVPRWALVVRPVAGLGQYDSNHPEADYTNLRENLKRRLADPELDRVIRRDIAYELDRQGGPDGLLIMDYVDKTWIGKTVGQVAKERGEDPVDTAIHIQMNGFERPGGIQLRAFAVSLARPRGVHEEGLHRGMHRPAGRHSRAATERLRSSRHVRDDHAPSPSVRLREEGHHPPLRDSLPHLAPGLHPRPSGPRAPRRRRSRRCRGSRSRDAPRQGDLLRAFSVQ